MKCSRNKCNNKPIYQAVFNVLPAGHPECIEPMTSYTEILACKEHATRESGLELLNNNMPGRASIEKAFSVQGFAPPDWDRSYCEWSPIEFTLDINGKMPGSDMKVREAIDKGRIWWDRQGGRQNMSRKLQEESNQVEVGRRFTPSNGLSAGILIPGDKEAVIKSGILQGKPWDQLDKREQLQIAQVWHLYHVIEPLRGVSLVHTANRPLH